MPDLKINTNNTRTSACYVRYPHATVNFSNLFFPFFSRWWLSLNQKVKRQRDLLVFKENLKVVYKPIRYRHFKYGTKIGHRFLAHLRVGRSYLNCTVLLLGSRTRINVKTVIKISLRIYHITPCCVLRLVHLVQFCSRE